MLPYDPPLDNRANVFYSIFSSIGSKGHTEFQALVTKINRISGTTNNFFKLRVQSGWIVPLFIATQEATFR